MLFSLADKPELVSQWSEHSGKDTALQFLVPTPKRAYKKCHIGKNEYYFPREGKIYVIRWFSGNFI